MFRRAPRLAFGPAALSGRSSLRNALALGAVLSCTDSVASLQLMDPDRAPLLYALLFGEGVVNDATAIVLLGATMVGREGGTGGKRSVSMVGREGGAGGKRRVSMVGWEGGRGQARAGPGGKRSEGDVGAGAEGEGRGAWSYGPWSGEGDGSRQIISRRGSGAGRGRLR